MAAACAALTAQATQQSRSALPNEQKKPWSRKPKWRGGAKPRQQAGDLKSRGHHHERHAAASDADAPIRLFGLHAVEAALANPNRSKLRMLATENAEKRLSEGGTKIEVAIERTTPRDLDRLLGADTVHQGVMLEVEPLIEPELAELVSRSDGRPLIVLDQVTDPHNVGAVLRSAAVFGTGGLIMTQRHSPPLNGVLAKSASGALELVPVALVPNLSRALDELKDLGFAVVGLDGGADRSVESIDWSQPSALVLGAEGKGLRELTRKTCDTLVRISTDGALVSLNVSNAAAVALHSAMLARRK